MWVFLSDAFLSIVESNNDPRTLLVRARAKEDLHRVFPDAPVSENPDRDYRFRAAVPREEVAQALAACVRGLAYGNFKDSVPEKDRASAYLGVWQRMLAFQDLRHPPARWDSWSASSWESYASFIPKRRRRRRKAH
jgi:hypothetical protein